MANLTVRQVLLVVAGIAAIAIGTIGIFVPLLPTTPFLLLAAACFARSSERLYAWLIRHRWFGAYIRNYREHRAITLGAKIASLTLLWTVIGFSAVFAASAWWLRGILVFVAVGVTIHLLLMKTYRPDRKKNTRVSNAAEPLRESQPILE